MAFRKNTGLQDAQADAFGNLFNGGTLQIRTGTQPADPNSAASGTLIVEIELPADAFSASTSGTISKLGTWAEVAVASASAGYGRFISSDTLKTFDVSVGESATDLIIDDVDIVSGNMVTVISFTFAVPSGV